MIRKSIMLSILWIFALLLTVDCQGTVSNITSNVTSTPSPATATPAPWFNITKTTTTTTMSTPTASATSLTTVIALSNTTTYSRTGTPTVPIQSDPSEPQEMLCFLNEKMKREVQIYHIISVRNVDSRFKIFNGPDTFDPMFFYPKIKNNGATNVPTMNPNLAILLNITNFTMPLMPLMNATNQTNLAGITGAWDTNTYDFHLVVPDQAFNKYKVNFHEYKRQASVIGMSFDAIRPSTWKWNVSEPYTCHYNTATNNTVCISIVDNLVTVGHYSTNVLTLPKETRFLLPIYLSFDAFFSYADTRGVDYILIHHKAQWIYRINYQEYLLNRQMYFKVFHLRTPPLPAFHFDSFVFADENGLVTRYVYETEDGQKHWRYYYSLFSEVSGLTTYCVHDRFIDGSLMIMATEMAPQENGISAALRSPLRLAKRDSLEIPTMLRILFYCATIYFTIFLGTQLVPVRKPIISKEVRRADREIQRLAPVIEKIMAKVYVFMENEKKASGKKDK